MLKRNKKVEFNRCNFTFKNVIIKLKGGKIADQGKKSDDDINKYCIDMEYTCCTFEEIQDLFLKVKDTVDIRQQNKNMRKFVRYFKRLKDDQIEYFFENNS